MAFDAAFSGSLPLLEATPYYSFTGSLPSLTAEGRLNDVYYFDGTLPKLTATGAIVGTQLYQFAGTLRPLSAAGTAQITPAYRFAGTLPRLSATGHIAVGRTYDFNGALPSLTAAGTMYGTGQFSFTGVLPSLSALGYADLSIGTVTAETTAWCVNLTTGGHSRYTNYPDLSSTTQIDAYVLTPATDFGAPTVKYVTDAYMYCRSDGELNLLTKTDEWIERTENIAVERETTGAVRRRVKLAKGIRGQNWQFKVSNTGGCNLELMSLEVVPLATRRHS